MARISLLSLPLAAPGKDAALRWPKLSESLIPWLLPLALFALWWLASRNHWMSQQILPPPSLVWSSAVELAGGELWSHLAISVQRLFWGLLAGVGAGALLGALLGFSARAERLIFPTFSALSQVPTLAWIPLFMVFFGIGETLKLVVLVKAIVVPVTLHTLVGVRDAQPNLREAARVLRLPAHLLIRRLILPAALPAFMAGIRLALAAGWTSLLAVELLASSEGIGYLMVWARQLFMLDIVFVCIVVIGVLGVVMDRGIGWLDRKWVHWPHPATAQIRRGPRYQGWQRLQPWLLPLLLVALWQMATQHGWVDANILVSPWAVLQTTGAKIRFLVTSADVIHSWWVPAFAVKRDAIPGFINEAWTRVEKPGLYRGQCAELCGKDHGFMPIVVDVKARPDYDAWLAERKAQAAQLKELTSKEWTLEELMARGDKVYHTACTACHQAEGQGLPPMFPALKGSPIAIGPKEDHLHRVYFGKPGTAMAAFGKQLSEVDIAAVVTYERNAWGNNKGDMVTPKDVLALKQAQGK